MPVNANEVIKGDCLVVLDQVADESIDLIYLDPPFFSQREHVLKTRNGKDQFSFSDHWESLPAYISFIRARIKICRAKLKPTGSLFLHCDRSASHYLKVMLDEIFGADNFQSDIIWSYKRWSNSKKGLLNHHQNILFFSKSSQFKFNASFENYSPSTNIEQILQLRGRDSRNKTVYQKDENGRPILAKEKKGVPMGDVWDIPYLNPKAKERVSYPTQKPILLLEKIISLVTNEGDIVLDPFCGSGTTLLAAQFLNRKFIGIDASPAAIQLSRARLKNPIKTNSKLLELGRHSYIKADSSIEAAVQSVGGVVVQRNKGIDGLVTTAAGIVPFKVVLTPQDADKQAQQISNSTSGKKFKKKALLAHCKMSSAEKKRIEKDYKLIVFANLKELSKKIEF